MGRLEGCRSRVWSWVRLCESRAGGAEADDLRAGQASDQQSIDVQIELAARWRVENGRKLALIARGREPAPVAEDVNFGAFAAERALAHADCVRVRPALERIRRQRVAQPRMMGSQCLRPHAGAGAFFDLPRKARSLASLQAERGPAQRSFASHRSQRLARLPSR